MASRTQVTKNLRDVNGAWGGFRDLIHTRFPTYSSFVDTARSLAKIRRNYR